ncbi:hypothetical protein GCM10023063_43170 [Arthrobacter methylotrophus]
MGTTCGAWAAAAPLGSFLEAPESALLASEELMAITPATSIAKTTSKAPKTTSLRRRYTARLGRRLCGFAAPCDRFALEFRAGPFADGDVRAFDGGLPWLTILLG